MKASCSSQLDLGGSSDQMACYELPRRFPVLPTFLLDLKLDGTNYVTSKVMMEAVLESYDLVEFVTLRHPRPDMKIHRREA